MATKKLVDYSFTSPNVFGRRIVEGGRNLNLVDYSSSSSSSTSDDDEPFTKSTRQRSYSLEDFSFARALFSAAPDITTTEDVLDLTSLTTAEPSSERNSSLFFSPSKMMPKPPFERRMTPPRACKMTPRTPGIEMTPIAFKGTRVHRRIIRSPSVDLSSVKREAKATKSKAKRTKKQVRINVTKDTTLDSTTTTPACTPRRKPKKQKASTSDDEEAAEPETTSTSNLTDVNRKKRWTAEDMAKLKLALKVAVNPTSDEHWELISRSLGGRWTVEECREKAIKLKWKSPFSEEQQKEERDKEAKLRAEQQQMPSSSSWGSAVKKRMSRRSFDCDNQFFKENVDLSLADLNLDDSLLTAFNTPPEKTKCARRPFLLRPVSQHNENTDDSSEEY